MLAGGIITSLSLVAGLLVSNFVGGETKIEHRIERLYRLDDPRFTQDPAHWRDTHVEVAGPVVAQMQSVFIDNWIKVTGDVLHGPGYFQIGRAHV